MQSAMQRYPLVVGVLLVRRVLVPVCLFPSSVGGPLPCLSVCSSLSVYCRVARLVVSSRVVARVICARRIPKVDTTPLRTNPCIGRAARGRQPVVAAHCLQGCAGCVSGELVYGYMFMGYLYSRPCVCLVSLFLSLSLSFSRPLTFAFGLAALWRASLAALSLSLPLSLSLSWLVPMMVWPTVRTSGTMTTIIVEHVDVQGFQGAWPPWRASTLLVTEIHVFLLWEFQVIWLCSWLATCSWNICGSW